METEHFNICLFCKRPFRPSPKHPHQKCCGSPNCRRIQDKFRQRECAKKRNKDPDRRMSLCNRKHDEYIRRKGKCKSDAPPPPPRPHITLYSLPDYIIGILQLLTLQKSTDELYRLMEHCRNMGRAVRL